MAFATGKVSCVPARRCSGSVQFRAVASRSLDQLRMQQADALMLLSEAQYDASKVSLLAVANHLSGGLSRCVVSRTLSSQWEPAPVQRSAPRAGALF